MADTQPLPPPPLCCHRSAGAGLYSQVSHPYLEQHNFKDEGFFVFFYCLLSEIGSLPLLDLKMLGPEEELGDKIPA